jgi:hypothetical protein
VDVQRVGGAEPQLDAFGAGALGAITRAIRGRTSSAATMCRPMRSLNTGDSTSYGSGATAEHQPVSRRVAHRRTGWEQRRDDAGRATTDEHERVAAANKLAQSGYPRPA